MSITWDQPKTSIQWDDGPIQWDDSKENRTILGTAGDIGLSLAKGIVGAGESVVGIADIPTMGLVGKALETVFGYDPKKTHEILGNLYSISQKQANKEVEKAKGFIGTTKAMVKNPSTIFQGAIESAPQMVGIGGIGKGLIKAGLKVSPLVAAAISEGAMSAGSTAEQIRQESESGFITPKQSGLSVATGTLTGAIALAGGRIAAKLGIADPDVLLAGGKVKGGTAGVVKRILEGGINEGVFEELPQSLQEQIFLNAALDRPLMQDVPAAGVQGAFAGALMGGVAGIFKQKATQNPQEFLDELTAQAQSGSVSVNDLINLKKDKEIQRLNIDDEINALIIEKQSETLTPRPVEELEATEEKIKPEVITEPAKEIDKRFRTEESANNFRDWVNLTGGLNLNDATYKGSFKDMRFDIDEQGNKRPRKGFPKGIWRSTGMGMDERTEQAIKAGWLPEGSTEDDFIELLEQNPNKTEKYSELAAGFEMGQPSEEEYYQERRSFLDDYTEEEIRQLEDEAETIEQERIRRKAEQYSLTPEETEELFRPIEKPKFRELNDITVKTKAIVESTGEEIEIEQNAKEAVDFVESQSEILYKIRACLEL